MTLDPPPPPGSRTVRDASDGCVAKYTYDGRDRLVKEDRGHSAAGAITDYVLTTAGSVAAETTNGVTTNYTYDGLQLDYATAGSSTSNYIYDPEGKIDCIVNSNSMTECPTGQQPSGLLKDYSWDDLNRLEDVETFKTDGTGTKTDDATYTYDALDRVVEQLETHSFDTASPKTRTTKFSFLGLSNLVTKETFSGNNALSDSKTYTYDAYDTRISMVDDPAGTATPKTYTYGYDTHGSVSTLLDDSTGTVKASYGYDAYGGKDVTLTDGDDANGRETDPLNPYRYTARRLDTGSGTLDMGARRFGPDAQTFLQPDYYQGALANLGLSMDPLTGNRYALAAGNPVSYVEFDGHRPLLDPGPAKAPGGNYPKDVGWEATASGDAGRMTNAGREELWANEMHDMTGGLDSLRSCENMPLTHEERLEEYSRCRLFSGAPGEPSAEFADEFLGGCYTGNCEPLDVVGRLKALAEAYLWVGAGLVRRGLGAGASRVKSWLGIGRRTSTRATRGLSRLPAYTGGKTQGILQAGGKEIDLVSGRSGPASQLPRGSKGFDIVTKSHVEGHAAAIMRMEGLQEATLYINRIPCASCARLLPRMLPEGAELTIYGPNNYMRVFRGL